MNMRRWGTDRQELFETIKALYHLGYDFRLEVKHIGSKEQLDSFIPGVPHGLWQNVLKSVFWRVTWEEGDGK